MIFVFVFVIALALGVPIFAVLGLSGAIPIQVVELLPAITVPQGLLNGLNSFPLIAIAGFVFAGILMKIVGITDGILDFARETVGRFPGGYAIMCIVASSFFAALTGAGPACTAAIGSITIPLMLGAGYDKGFTSAVAAGGGTLGVMIPPSNPMIIYSIIAGTSVSDMFLAGIVPGIYSAILLCLLCVLIAKKRGYHGTKDKFSFSRLLKSIWHAKYGLFAPILILGSIYGGIATPTESAILACVYTVLVGIFQRKLSFKQVWEALRETVDTCGSIIIIMGVSTVFARLLTVYQIPQTVATLIGSITTSPYILQLMVLLLMVFVGMWLDPLAAIIIVTPIFLPLLKTVGVDPVAFGILLVLCTQIAFITPPVASNLYVVARLTKSSLPEVSTNVIPFICVLAIVAITLIFVPELATLLPTIAKA